MEFDMEKFAEELHKLSQAAKEESDEEKKRNGGPTISSLLIQSEAIVYGKISNAIYKAMMADSK